MEKMEREKRAKQFAPFDALAGFREAIRLKEYEYESKMKKELSIDIIDKISNNMKLIKKESIIKLKYYEDGHELEYIGNIKLDIENLFIEIKNKIIMFDNILDLDIIE